MLHWLLVVTFVLASLFTAYTIFYYVYRFISFLNSRVDVIPPTKQEAVRSVSIDKISEMSSKVSVDSIDPKSGAYGRMIQPFENIVYKPVAHVPGAKISPEEILSRAVTNEVLQGRMPPEVMYTHFKIKYGPDGFATQPFPDFYDQQLLNYIKEFYASPSTVLPLLSQINLFWYVLLTGVLVCLFVVLAFFLNRSVAGFYNTATYECGFKAIELRTHATDIQFFQISILFLLFDVEILVFFPWVLNFYNINKTGHLVIFIVFLLLCLGFYYELRTNTLRFYPQA
jgi:NADH-ubiquinone oxidoreductase chain 3